MNPLRAAALRHMLVRRAIEAEIADGTLQPGDRIPSERDLAVRFGVSRVTVRRALGELAEKGLIDSRQGRGTFVAVRPLGEAHNALMSFTALGESRGLVPSAIVLSQRIYFELDPRVFIRLADAERYRAFRLALEECLELRPGDTSPRAERLRETRDFYAYMEREVSLLIERYQVQRPTS